MNSKLTVESNVVAIGASANSNESHADDLAATDEYRDMIEVLLQVRVEEARRAVRAASPRVTGIGVRVTKL